MNHPSALQVCAEQVAPIGTARYYSFRLLPAEQRSALIGLYAFQKALLEINLQNLDRQVALSKLNWWRSEINNLFEGKASHPAAILLQEATQKYSLHRQRFHNIANAVEADLHTEQYATDTELIQFFTRSWGETEMLAAKFFSGSFLINDELERVCKVYQNLGVSFALMANLIRLIEKKENIYVSGESLSKFNLKKSDLASINEPSVRNFINQQIEIIEKYAALGNDASGHRIMLAIQRKILQKIKLKKQLKPTDCHLSPLRMFWMMCYYSEIKPAANNAL
jgi:phytoene synthase